ncbi:MAG: hypothetical protein PHU67_06110 [Sulfurovum sp.]|nr:hypothetical protein [Sulfurovum sp.]MDD3499974.1 hypothetical protein [Sulfurovum sp.]
MDTKNDEITIQTTQKENWEKPELSELDINATENRLGLGGDGLLTRS